MHTGLLWFDDSKLPLGDKITKAKAYFIKKYDRVPNLCLVHPSMLTETRLDIPGLTVKPYRPVLPGHLWIGIEEDK